MTPNAPQSFLFEIFSEEIPAKMQAHALKAASEIMEALLNGIEHGTVTATCAPRRLCVTVDAVAVETAPVTIEKRGPRVTAPEAALQGFLRVNNVRREELTEQNGYFYAISNTPGRPFLESIPNIVRSFTRLMPWPKSMRWAHPKTGRPTAPWVRPVHAVVCLWGEEPVVFDLEDWGLTTGNVTYGHRFLSNVPLTVTSSSQHAAVLKEHFVIADYADRQAAIIQAIDTALAQKGLTVKPDPELLDEVTGLIDQPFIVVGEIESRFMALPPEVLSTSMRVHQKYFATMPKDVTGSSALAPFFVAVSNQPATDAQKKGFEKVLRARLSDALFFYEEDLKTPLDSRAPQLDHIIFHAKLGTLAHKVDRLTTLVKETPTLERAARLCKVDLVSHMVGEFDELQGIMGAHYALKQGECPEVALAIEDHYRPIGQGGALPSIGAKLAIADRLDSLVGFLGVGIRPTGSKDPFALRRAALGILRIILEGAAGNDVSLATLIETDRTAYEAQGIVLCSGVAADVTQFLYERLAVYAREQKGVRYDVVQAVLSFGRQQADALDVRDLMQRMAAWQPLSEAETSDLRALFIRLKGILAGERVTVAVQEFLFQDSCEKALYQTLQAAEAKISTALAQKNYTAALKALSGLKKPTDAALEAVHVRTSEVVVTQNRLALLTREMDLFDQIADFGPICEGA